LIEKRSLTLNAETYLKKTFDQGSSTLLHSGVCYSEAN